MGGLPVDIARVSFEAAFVESFAVIRCQNDQGVFQVPSTGKSLE